MPGQDPRRKQMINSMFEIRGAEFGRCFWPDMECKRPAIRAHSVQNATSLDLLAERGHVVTPVMRLDANDGPSIQLRRVGRNKATTFAGLCAEHDRQIFAPIETGTLDLANPEHRFLLAYRATFYEVHSTAAAAVMVQSGYLKRVELGLDLKDVPTPLGMFAVERMAVAWQTWVYKSTFDMAYLGGEFNCLEHDLIEISVERPTVAASVLFSLDGVERDDDIVRVCLTVLPVSTQRTIALFSYLPVDAGRARLALDRVLLSTGAFQKYELSRRLINHSQNFVLAPSFVSAWTPTRAAMIVDLFTRTIMKNDLAFEDPDLTLFL